jgi:hypothetical protein
LSFGDWLHKKAEENAHNEILAFLMAILGMNLLIGGLLATIIVVGEPTSFLFFIQLPLNFSAALGLIMTVVGFSLVLIGFILVFHYDRKRSWYIGEIEKSGLRKKQKSTPKTASEILEEYTGKRKRS